MFNYNLLVISYYFPPMGLSGVQRTMKFVKYLPEYGWNVKVLSHNPTKYYAFDESLLDELDRDGIEIFRTDSGKNKSGLKKVSKFPSYWKQKAGRAFLQTIYQPDSKIKWKKKALALGEKIIKEHNINAIFATAPPFTGFLVAAELAERFNKPFVVDYRDLWNNNQFHFYATPLHKNYSMKLEQQILTNSEKIIVTTRHAKEILLKNHGFLSHDDIRIIEHGFDPEDFKNNNFVKDRSKLVITHSGLFQDNRTPKYFLKALSEFLNKRKKAKGQIELRFIGLMRPGHSKLIKKYGLAEITKLIGYQSHGETVKNIMESDVLWYMLNDKVRSPGKLYEYFGSGKTILACVPEGQMKALSEESGAAYCTEPKDVAGIVKALNLIYKDWQNGSMKTPDPEFVKKYDRKMLTGQLARELAMIAEI